MLFRLVFLLRTNLAFRDAFPGELPDSRKAVCLLVSLAPGPLPQWPHSPKKGGGWEVGLENPPGTLLGGVLGSQGQGVSPESLSLCQRQASTALGARRPGSIPQICPALGTPCIIAQTLSPKAANTQQRRATGLEHSVPSRT